MNTSSSGISWSRRALGIAVVWAVLAALLAVTLWPDTPRSSYKWFLLLGFGPPLYVLAEAFFGWLLSATHGQAISKRRFSLLRVLFALAFCVPFFVAWLWAARWISGP